MADDADLTDAHLEREMQMRLAALRRRQQALPYSGQCYWCGEDVAPPKRWCDADCRDEWERQQRRGA
ncbi:MAG: hypothetical protein ACK4MJ_12285 [Hylemonella sp.]